MCSGRCTLDDDGMQMYVSRFAYGIVGRCVVGDVRWMMMVCDVCK